MNEVIRRRLLVLVGLAIIGVGLAGVGTALGVAGPLSDTGTSAEFVVSEGNVTFESGGESVTVVKNLSDVSEITIEETEDGEFAIETTEDQPLADAEQEQARRIALNNDTVARALNASDEYELSVEPIQRMNVSASSQQSFDVVTEPDETNGELLVRDDTTGNHGGRSVTVERDPDYVEDRAVVRIRQPGATERHELKYTVNVDLANETVTGVTDWDRIREGSPSVDGTAELG